MATLLAAGCAQLNGGRMFQTNAETGLATTASAEPDAATPGAKPHTGPVSKPPEGKVATPKVAPKAVAAAPPPPRYKPASAPAAAGCSNGEGCVSRLKSLVEAPNRSWIRQREAPAVFASGVRLFAYRGLRSKLTCSELALAMEEIEGAAKVFEGAVDGVKPEQLGRARTLANQVQLELRAERGARCGPGKGNVGPAAHG